MEEYKKVRTGEDGARLPGLSEEELSVIYRTAPIGLCVLDRELRFVRINDHLAAINGLPPEEHVGRSVREVLPAIADQAEPLLRRVLETGQPLLDVEISGETEREPGVIRFWREQFYPLRQDGHVVGINVVAEEITKRKAARRSREQSEAHFRALANAMPQLVWTSAPDGTVEYYNERFREYHGLQERDEGQWEWAEVLHPDDLDTTIAAWQEAIGSGEAYEVEHRLRRADGSYRWYLSRAVPLRDEAGQIVRWYGTTTDIHAQLEAEKALRASEKKFRAIFEVSAVGQAEIDPSSGRLLAVNHHMCALTGYEEAELLTMTHSDLTHPDDRATDEARFAAAAEEGHEHHSDKRYVRKDGTVRWVHVRASFILDEQGQPVRAVKMVVDVTERVEAEAEREQLIARLGEEQERLRELNETLEARVQMRTRSLEAAHREAQRARDLFFTLFHANPTATVLTVPESGEIVDVNAAYLSFFGLKREEAVGKTTSELNIFATDVERERIVAEFRRSGTVEEMELRVRVGTEQIRTVLASVATVEVGGEQMALSTFIDVTPLLQAEQRIRQLASELTLAEERERRRIAQILHDDVQQMLVGLQIMLMTHAPQASSETQEVLEQADTYLMETLDMTRALSTELNSPTFKSPLLKDSFIWVAALMEERYNLSVKLDVEEAGSVENENARGTIVRLVRELLFNVVKHAGVDEATIHAHREPDALVIYVEDEGGGFEPSLDEVENGGTGFGLASMEERLALFGGKFDVDTAPGKGTRVTLTLPV